MRVPYWFCAGILAACASANSDASNSEPPAKSGTPAAPQVASSQCTPADAGVTAVGEQDGDRLENINGYDIANPEAALDAFSRLRTANELNVELNRDGCPTSLQIHIK